MFIVADLYPCHTGVRSHGGFTAMQFSSKAQWGRRKLSKNPEIYEAGSSQYALDSLTARSLRSHCALTTLSLRPMRSQFDHRRALTALPPRSTRSRCDQGDLATTSLRPYYALTTSPLRSVRLYHVRAATINTASSTAGDTAMVKRRCTL